MVDEMKQEGGIIPLTWDQEEMTTLRLGETVVKKGNLSQIVEQLVDLYGLEPVKAEIAEIERKIDLCEREIMRGPISEDTRLMFNDIEQYIGKLRNG